ncbi:MAG: ABC transporter ATP-binding protein [Verrucomicrobia bacterium]|nr:ABC transporter ATP-binding protein [Verrucomicrobiota bacterium]
MSEPAISIRNLSKRYRLGTIGRQTLIDETKYWWHKLRGRDPRQAFEKIGYSATERRRVEAEQAGSHEFWALRDVSFDVQPGEVIGIIGRNGAGKSTLLKVLSRITEPTAGEVELRGRIGSLLEVGTGFHPELTGRENVFMNGTILGMKEREVARKLDEIVAFAEIEKFIDTPVKRYSSGMYVRLAFAVAAHLEPEILIVDEVLAVGDAEFQSKCLGRMADVSKEGRTILFVSHNMAAIQSLCSRAVLLQGGQCAMVGSVQEATEAYLRTHLPKAAHLPIGERTDRGGDGQVRFTAYRILNERNLEIGAAQSGETITIELDFEKKTSGDAPCSLYMQVANEKRQRMFLCFSRISHPGVLRMGHRGTVRLTIPHLPLLPGRYFVHLSCKVGKALADELIDGVEFDVVEGDFFGTGKLRGRGGESGILVAHHWEVVGGE